MQLDAWKYYKHMLLPNCAPHESLKAFCEKDGIIWNGYSEGKVFLARWTTEFDCTEKTNWWYLIKDTPFDMQSLKSRRRYEINKGNRNFRVEKIDPVLYAEQLYEVMKTAYLAYPAKYRPSLSQKEAFVSTIQNWRQHFVYAAFSNEDQRLCGFILATPHESYIDFAMQKVLPEYEKQNVNFSLIRFFLEDNRAFLENGGYICDGERNVSHETAFQDFLEKYFGFRKAYCRLNVCYNPQIKWLIKTLFPLRKLLRKLDKIRIVHQINSVLKIEAICRGKAI